MPPRSRRLDFAIMTPDLPPPERLRLRLATFAPALVRLAVVAVVAFAVGLLLGQAFLLNRLAGIPYPLWGPVAVPAAVPAGDSDA